MKTINITLVLMLFVLRAFSYNSVDSLGVRNINGKTYIVHKVQDDETLYGLLKRYECTAGDVLAINPELKNSSTIYVNQIIKFPTFGIVSTSNSKTKTHTVRAGETLYSISRLHGVPLAEIRSLNGMVDNNIRTGQTIKLRESKDVATPVATNILVSKPKVELPVVSEEVTVMVVPNAPVGERVSETGIAQVIQTGRKSNKHLALHRTAPVGSLMTIKNEATGDKVMVKVIGSLPETGENDNVLVRISPSAYNKLRPRDTSLRAEVVYSLPPSK